MSRPALILLAEDNDIDAEWVSRCARRAGLANPLIWAADGREALDILTGADERGPLERPLVVLLDLNMPRMNGLELLGEIRQMPDLADIPIVVLTTSDLPADRAEAERHRVYAYLNKPITEDQLIGIVADIEQSHADAGS